MFLGVCLLFLIVSVGVLRWWVIWFSLVGMLFVLRLMMMVCICCILVVWV